MTTCYIVLGIYVTGLVVFGFVMSVAYHLEKQDSDKADTKKTEANAYVAYVFMTILWPIFLPLFSVWLAGFGIAKLGRKFVEFMEHSRKKSSSKKKTTYLAPPVDPVADSRTYREPEPELAKTRKKEKHAS